MSTRTFLNPSLTGLTLLAAVTLPSTGHAAEAANKIRVPLGTRGDVTPAHNWAEVAQTIKETLVSSGRFDVRVCEDANGVVPASKLRVDQIELPLTAAELGAVARAAFNGKR